MSEVRCPYCGEWNRGRPTFCRQCGKPLENGALGASRAERGGIGFGRLLSIVAGLVAFLGFFMPWVRDYPPISGLDMALLCLRIVESNRAKGWMVAMGLIICALCLLAVPLHSAITVIDALSSFGKRYEATRSAVSRSWLRTRGIAGGFALGTPVIMWLVVTIARDDPWKWGAVAYVQFLPGFWITTVSLVATIVGLFFSELA